MKAEEAPKPEAEAPASAAAPDCTTDQSTLASYEPSDAVVGKVAEIRDRGRLIVGVSADTYLMGSANPESGNKIEGFDIDFAKAIGRAIFEDTPGRLAERLMRWRGGWQEREGLEHGLPDEVRAEFEVDVSGDEVEVELPSDGKGFGQRLDADLLPVVSHQSNFAGPDPVVDPWLAVGRRRGYRRILFM